MDPPGNGTISAGGIQRRFTHRQHLSAGGGETRIRARLHPAEREEPEQDKLDQRNDEPFHPCQGDLPGKLPGNQMGENRIAGLNELLTLWAALEQRWSDYLLDLNPDSLEDVVYKKSTSVLVGNRFGTRRSDILLHVCTHAQYTTAQIINMLRQCGVEKLPDTMLILMARQEAS